MIIKIINQLKHNFISLMFLISIDNLYVLETYNKIYILFKKIKKLCDLYGISINYYELLLKSIKTNNPIIFSYCLKLFTISSDILNQLKHLTKKNKYFNIQLLLKYPESSYKLVFLIRHGESYGNIKQWPYKYDPPLTENGIKQSKILRDIVKKYKLWKGKVYSSPLIRAIETSLYSIPSSTIIKIIPHHFEFSDQYKTQDKIEDYFKNTKRLNFENFKIYSDKTLKIANKFDNKEKKIRLQFFSDWLIKNNNDLITIYGHGYFYKLFTKLEYNIKNTEVIKLVIPIKKSVHF